MHALVTLLENKLFFSFSGERGRGTCVCYPEWVVTQSTRLKLSEQKEEKERQQQKKDGVEKSYRTIRQSIDMLKDSFTT
jgi:hypothetical protein